MTLGQAIRAIREEAGLSQKDVAGAVGIDQSYLSMIESDQRRNPGTRIMARLAQVLQVSMDELAARAGLLPRVEEPDPLAQQALRLFRQLPRWRQEDVVAQLELYLRLQNERSPSSGDEWPPSNEDERPPSSGDERPRIIGGEEENDEAQQASPHSEAA